MVGSWQRERVLVGSCARAPRMRERCLSRRQDRCDGLRVEQVLFGARCRIPPSQPIETLTVMAYGSQTEVECYPGRIQCIQLFLRINIDRLQDGRRAEVHV